MVSDDDRAKMSRIGRDLGLGEVTPGRRGVEPLQATGPERFAEDPVGGVRLGQDQQSGGAPFF